MRYLALLLTLLTLTAKGQEKIDLWEGTTMPNTRGLVVQDSIANERVYKVGRPAIYRVAPAAEKNRGIAVVICPGGGYQRYAWEVAGWDIARWLANEGI
ncbi:MAG: alpha/beta hydrolase, partial [Alistipes sp.]|nr:alpha/beta hydrolase [Alistipes sp.]